MLRLGNPTLLLSDKVSRFERAAIMDVYLNTRRELLVVKKGCSIPAVAAAGSWRKKRKRVVRVSEEIESAVQTRGYYMRKRTSG